MLTIPDIVTKKAAMMSVLMLIRIPKEEGLLHEEFGGAWEDYCTRTVKKLIPFVY